MAQSSSMPTELGMGVRIDRRGSSSAAINAVQNGSLDICIEENQYRDAGWLTRIYCSSLENATKLKDILKTDDYIAYAKDLIVVFVKITPVEAEEQIRSLLE